MMRAYLQFGRAFIKTPFFKVIVLGIVLRVLLWILRTELYFQEIVEIVQPVRSYKRVEEAMFFNRIGLSPYSSPMYQQIPLAFLPFMFTNTVAWISGLLVRAVLLTLDVATAWMLGLFVAEFSTFNATTNPALLSAALYLLNPVTILCTVSLTAVPVRCFLVMWCLYASVAGWIIRCVLSLALLVVIFDVHLLALVIPITLMLMQVRKYTDPQGTLISVLFLLTGFLIMFYYISLFALDGDSQFLWKLFSRGCGIYDLTPNWGIYWYMFMEMFKDFGTLWQWVFQAALWMYPIPLFIRFYNVNHSGVLLYVIYIAIYTVMMASPTWGDYVFLLVLMYVACDDVFKRIPGCFLGASTLLVTAAIGPSFFHAWAYSGTGNANFFYFVTLGFNGVMVNMVSRFIKSALVIEQERVKQLKQQKSE